MTNIELIKKVIGPINPIGQSSEDEVRFENLKVMCDLMDDIHTAIDAVAYNNRDSKEASVKRAVDYANNFLDKLIKE